MVNPDFATLAGLVVIAMTAGHPVSPAGKHTKPIPVIFDTDIGIDDAMALLFLHFSPDVELHAIVSGFGNASIDDTTRNALFIKERFGIDAPVFRGADKPLGSAPSEISYFISSIGVSCPARRRGVYRRI